MLLTREGTVSFTIMASIDLLGSGVKPPWNPYKLISQCIERLLILNSR